MRDGAGLGEPPWILRPAAQGDCQGGEVGQQARAGLQK